MAKQPGDAKNTTSEEKRFLKEHQEGLSDTTTKYAKWIHSADEHEDHEGQSLATRSHEVIRHWAERRNAKPATVPGTEHDNRPGVLRFDFPDYGGGELEDIGWDKWFESFDARNLVFLFQEHTSDGNDSNFFRLDNPERADA